MIEQYLKIGERKLALRPPLPPHEVELMIYTFRRAGYDAEIITTGLPKETLASERG